MGAQAIGPGEGPSVSLEALLKAGLFGVGASVGLCAAIGVFLAARCWVDRAPRDTTSEGRDVRASHAAPAARPAASSAGADQSRSAEAERATKVQDPVRARRRGLIQALKSLQKQRPRRRLRSQPLARLSRQRPPDRCPVTAIRSRFRHRRWRPRPRPCFPENRGSRSPT